MELQLQLYRLDLAYNGASFHGWQSQPSKRGIQDAVESILKILLRHPVRIKGSSRTDTGVHAEMQVATFRSAPGLRCQKIVSGLNGLLPTDVRVLSLRPVDVNFDPMGSSQGKAYRYRIWNTRVENPFFSSYVWHIRPPVDWAKVSRNIPDFIGTHDFTSFCAADSVAKSKIRTVWEIELDHRGDLTDFWITGEGFLKQMVRNIVGTLIGIGTGKIEDGVIPELMAKRDRRASGRTAPAQGLSLVEIFFERTRTIAELKSASLSGFYFGVPQAEIQVP